MSKSLLAVPIYGLLFCLHSAGAATPDEIVSDSLDEESVQALQVMRKSVAIFSSTMEEALELDGDRGLFGIVSGGVSGTYLYQQGVVLTVQTPLAGRRNRLNLGSLQSSLQTLTLPGNPFARVQRPTISPTPEIMALTLRQDSVGDFYRELMAQLAETDVSATVGTAIQQASDAVRALRAYGQPDDQAYRNMVSEIERMRDRLSSESKRVRDFESELRSASNQSDDGIDASARAALQRRLSEIVAAIEPLRTEVVARANELAQRSDLARSEYLQQWRQDVVDFESSIYQSLCSYATGLRELADEEKVTIILSGLGDEVEDGRRTDKHHVVAKTDLAQCQSGAINVAALRQRSVSYSF